MRSVHGSEELVVGSFVLHPDLNPEGEEVWLIDLDIVPNVCSIVKYPPENGSGLGRAGRRTFLPSASRNGLPSAGMAGTGGPAIESVDRALRLLQELGRHGSGATLDELAGAAGFPKSSVHRTLASLRERGFVSQHDDGKYLIGSELLRVAFDFYERIDVRSVLRPLLVRLSERFNETVHLGVLDGGDVVYLDKLESTHPIALTSRVGGRNPAHCTAVGKALLAWSYPTDEALRAWVARRGPLERRTQSSITTVDALIREAARIRADGFARDREESELGVRCVAVPLFLGGTLPRAAVSISAPKERLPASRMREIGPSLIRATREAALLGETALLAEGT
jgi:IclR family transcriptional regulator, KDG regulon repressor